MLLFRKIGIFCILFFVFLSCRKPTNANWDVDAVLPVVNSVLNIKNFVNNSIFASDSSGLLHVSINREVVAIKLDSLLKLPDTTLIVPVVSPFPAPIKLGPGQVVPNLNGPSELTFNISNGIKLKKVDIKTGILNVKFGNDLAQPMDVKYLISTASKNGIPFLISETVPPGTASLIKSYDLSGYNFDMRGLLGNEFNTLGQSYTLSINPKADTVIVNYNQGVHMEIGYTNIAPAYAEGYFGRQIINLPLDTARLGFADNFKASNFLLSDATMDFEIKNEFGVSFSAALSNIKSISTANNNIVALSTNQLSNLNINAATKAGDTFFPSIKSLSFTTANSNITGFISNLPDKLTYQGTIKMNPVDPGNISGYNDFAFYDTGIRIEANIDIPLRYTADYFELASNAKVDFSNVAQLNKVNYGNFVISATNGFPFSIKLQGYMYDGQNNILDSLFVPGSNVIERGSIDYNNIVTSPTFNKLYVPVTKTKIDNLRKCKTIRIVSRFIMPKNPPEMKILENYELDINIVAELNYNVGLGN
jgi:hypothetical protein